VAILRTLLASLALLLAGGAALSAATGRFQAFTTEAARRLAIQQHPAQTPAVPLQLQSGIRTGLADLRGKWLLVDFIYTRCPTYCLALGSEFAQLQDRLAGPIAQGRVQLLSISFDPQNDDREALQLYGDRWGAKAPGWRIAAPADDRSLAALLQSFGVVVIADGMGGFIHNSAVYLVDGQGRLARILDPDAPPQLLARALSSSTP